MSLRKSHGTYAKKNPGPVIEVPPIDELHPIVASGPLAEPTGPLVRRQDGKIDSSETARELGRRGGIERARRRKLATAMSRAELADDNEFKPYLEAAETFAAERLAEMARFAGVISSAVSSFVTSAAWDLAYSRFYFDKAAETHDPDLAKLGSSHGVTSRQNLFAAWHQAELEVKSRPQENPIEHFARMMKEHENGSK